MFTAILFTRHALITSVNSHQERQQQQKTRRTNSQQLSMCRKIVTCEIVFCSKQKTQTQTSPDHFGEQSPGKNTEN